MDALPRLTDAVDEVAHATRALLAGGADAAFVASLKVALRDLADMYGVATGVPCRVTVKMTHVVADVDGRPDVAVRTICRSHGGASGRSPSGVDLVADNTDFRWLFDRGDDVFFCNDLPAAVERGYRNSHFTFRVVAAERYPYRSTIVWPVRARVAYPERTVDDWLVIGFLCVDAPKRNVFDARSDVAPGAAFAHALYSGLVRFHENARHGEDWR